MTYDACVRCKELTVRGSYPTWSVVLAVLLFPLGLLCLLVGRNPTLCSDCLPQPEGSDEEPDYEPHHNRSVAWGILGVIVLVVILLVFSQYSNAQLYGEQGTKVWIDKIGNPSYGLAPDKIRGRTVLGFTCVAHDTDSYHDTCYVLSGGQQ